MTERVTVLDLGAGNLWNLERALRHLGADVEVTTAPDRVAAARCIVLPGVGAFAPAREALRGEREAALREAVEQGAWLLGICLGYQLLFEESEEFGPTDGLGLLPGRVSRLPSSVPVPHIGWNRLHDLKPHSLVGELGAQPSSHLFFYFVHGYAPEGVPEHLCVARCTHGRPFPAAVACGRVLGTQFHPERSGEAGLRLLANFLEMTRAVARPRAAARA